MKNKKDFGDYRKIEITEKQRLQKNRDYRKIDITEKQRLQKNRDYRKIRDYKIKGLEKTKGNKQDEKKKPYNI